LAESIVVVVIVIVVLVVERECSTGRIRRGKRRCIQMERAGRGSWTVEGSDELLVDDASSSPSWSTKKLPAKRGADTAGQKE